jgi:two-component system cell cycle response regulator CtrA
MAMSSAEKIQALEDRIADLEAALGMTARIPSRLYRKLKFSRWRPCEKLLGMFMTREMLTREACYLVLYEMREEENQPSTKLVDVYVCALRAALKPYDIEIKNVWGKGWYMPAESKKKLAELIAEHQPSEIAA